MDIATAFHTIQSIIAWVQANLGNIVSGLLMIIGGASVFAKFTPTPKDDAILDNLLRIVNKIALNKKPEA